MYNRRSFLKLTGAAACGGLMLGGSVSSFGQRKESFPLPETIFSDGSYTFNQQTFEPLINTTFGFKNDDDSQVSMKLVEVVAKDMTKSYSSRIPTDSFMLIFEIREKVVLEDRIFQVSHSALSDFPMFISVVGRSGRRYQAVFNRVYF